MAREIESAHRFTYQQSKWSLEHERLVLRCDDGAVYEFSRPVDGAPAFRLARRFFPDGRLSTSNGRLPSAVEETASAMLERWSK